jgi:hypothetical protein
MLAIESAPAAPACSDVSIDQTLGARAAVAILRRRSRTLAQRTAGEQRPCVASAGGAQNKPAHAPCAGVAKMPCSRSAARALGCNARGILPPFMAHEEAGWIELNIEAKRPPTDILRDVADPLVHDEFTEDWDTWHFFWEPEGLRLRFRWRDLERQQEIEHRLAETLDRWRDDGRFDAWWSGHHGVSRVRHYGEAEAYGPEVWDLITKEWEVSSELAIRFALLGEGGLTGTEHRTFERHWERHVHLHTNRQFLSLEFEIWLSLKQASGYLINLICSAKDSGDHARVECFEKVKERVDDALRMLAAWPQ